MAELTPRQAYDALIHFLKAVRLRTRSPDVNVLLELLQFLGDDLPVDPALWEAWLANVQAVGQPLTEERAFTAAARFLSGYLERGRVPALVGLIAAMRFEADGTPTNPAIWQEWRIAVQRALSPHERAETHSARPAPPHPPAEEEAPPFAFQQHPLPAVAAPPPSVHVTPLRGSQRSNNGFTVAAQEVLRQAHEIAQQKRHPQLDVEHILLALLTPPNSVIAQIIRQVGSDPRLLRQQVNEILNNSPRFAPGTAGDGSGIHISIRTQRMVSEAANAAFELEDDNIDVTHLLLALTEEHSGTIPRLLEELNVDRAHLQAALRVKHGTEPAVAAQFESPDRYSRQAILPGIGAEGQARIRAGRVAILGLGALGAALAEALARAGVGTLRLADRDVLEAHNLQRQNLYTEADVVAALPKAVAATARLGAINRQTVIQAQIADIDTEAIEGFIDGMDVVLDGTDNFAARYLLNDACLRQGIPWIYNGVIGTSGLSLTIRPGQTACLRCLYPDPPPPGSTATCETAGVLGPAVQTVAALAAAATLQLLVGADPPRGLLAVDLWTGTFDRIGAGERDPACPACGAGRYDFLRGGALAALQSAQLCGRATVQVRLDGGRLDLPPLAARLREAGLGQIHANAHLIRLQVAPHELTIFPDGRVIVKGTDDPAEARSLVARYVGF